MGLEWMRLAVLHKGVVISSNIQPQIDVEPTIALQKR